MSGKLPHPIRSSYNGIQDERIGWAAGIADPYPLILNLLKDVIPRVAEESAMPNLDSISGFLDSSATLGMTWWEGRLSGRR